MDQEIQVGKDNAAQVDKEMPLVKDAQLNQYIQNLGHKLAAKAPGYQYPYNFKIVNQKEINAFALPGGPIYVNLGTIQFNARNWKEAERYYLEALDADPKYALAHFDLANLYDERGDRIKAQKHYQAALDLLRSARQ